MIIYTDCIDQLWIEVGEDNRVKDCAGNHGEPTRLSGQFTGQGSMNLVGLEFYAPPRVGESVPALHLWDKEGEYFCRLTHVGGTVTRIEP